MGCKDGRFSIACACVCAHASKSVYHCLFMRQCGCLFVHVRMHLCACMRVHVFVSAADDLHRIMHTFCHLCSDHTSHYHCYSGHTEVVKVLLETVRFEFSVDCFGFGNASALMSGKFREEE